MKKHLAVFTTSWGMHVVLEAPITGNDYIQLSESMDIDFPDLPKEIIASNQLLAIDKLIEEAKQDAIIKMNELNQRKQELLALTVQS